VMRKRPDWMLALAALLVALVVTAPAAQAGDVTLLGRVTAKAAILVDNRSAEVLFSRNPDLQLPPASTTKILTAYIALRSGRGHQAVPVSRYASEIQPSKIGLRPGWLMNVEDLTYAVLLNSANDASVVLAEGLGGSVPGFARIMNDNARDLGATHSWFVNPNGLPAEGHYSTVRDLTTIMHHALREPRFRSILSTRETVIQPYAGSRRLIALRSHNRLLDNPDVRELGIRVIGKTGWTREARRCFVGAAMDDEREILVSVLGSNDLWGDLRRLIDYAFDVPSRNRYLATDDDWQRASVAPFPKTVQRNAGEGDRSAVRYHVRLGSFRSRPTADGMRRKVIRLGYPCKVEAVRAKRQTLYRVTVSNFASRKAAHKAAQTLRRSCQVEPSIVAERT